MNKLLRGFVVIATALFFACSQPFSGGSSQQGNGRVIGRVVDTLGVPVAGAKVHLLPALYDPVKDSAVSASFTAVTDDSGGYGIGPVPKGDYALEVHQCQTKADALVAGIAVSSADTVKAPEAILRQPGFISVDVPKGTDTGNVYVYVPGTTSFAFVKSGQTVVLSVPAGVAPAVNSAVRGETTPPVTIQSSVDVTSGDTSRIVDVHLWKYSKNLYLNTTASGAGVSGNVTNFPVLVRLTSGNFPFAEAGSGGGDIRFEKPNGTPLPYQIERWDPSGRAEVWVKVDTVYGNDSTRYIVMLWGNPNASDASNNPAVFATANGFQGVWHLGESSGIASDATDNHYNGAYGGSLPKSTGGIIGNCQNFDGKSDVVSCGNVLNVGSGNVSISAWARRTSTGTATQVLVGKSNGGGPSAVYGYSFAFYPTTTFNFAVASGGTLFGDSATFRMLTKQTIADTGNWHFIAGVINRSSNGGCSLYIDGIAIKDSVEGNIQGVGDLVNDLDFRIGMQADGARGFQGLIDEVVVANVPRSADWVKLCYMNQKAADALIMFR